MKHIFHRICSLALTVAVTASLAVPAAAVDATAVALTQVTMELEPEGGQKDLTASVSPEGADPNSTAWTTSDAAVAKLSAQTGKTVTITGGTPGTATIKATAGTGEATCAVTVRGVTLSEESIVIPVGTSKQLGAAPHGGIGTHKLWSSGNESVAFVSSDGNVTGQSVGKTIITVEVGGYTASCEVTVRENTANTISASVDAGQPFSFADIRGEMNARSWDVLGESLSYVTNLRVSTDEGILYYGYASPDDTGFGVGSTERYYYSDSVAGQRSLSSVSFVSQADFDGDAVIRYTGYGSGNKSFTGSIKLAVSGTSDVAYTTASDTPVQFRAADFSVVCRERGGRDLSYVTFEQPSARRGTLYYNYGGQGQYSEEVSSGTKYDRTHSPYLDSVSFVPQEGYTGTVRVNYRCVDTSGNSFSGQVTVTVTEKKGAGEEGEVSYSTGRGERVDFSTSDFNKACRDVNGASLDYVRFELPNSSKGTLYEDYRSSGWGDSVSENTRYYRSGSPSISDLTFVPKSGYSGTVYLDFTGYDVDGDPFDGRVVIKVSGNGGTQELRYSTAAGRPVTFSAADFNEACLDENGESLRYVRFELPSSSRGTLYYNYSGGSGSRVAESTSYYRSGTPSLSKVTFVPKTGYSGMASIDFNGYDTAGGRFNGTVKIDVGEADDETIKYSVSSKGAVTFDASDFNEVCRSLTDSSLRYVRFELPASSRGTLYYGYDRDDGSYSSKVTGSTNYYRSGGNRELDEVTFVPNGKFSGTVEIPCTGWSTSDEKFTCTVEISVAAPTPAVTRYTGSSTPIQIQAADLRAVCNAQLGRELSHIQFSMMPSASAGRLYLSYVLPSQPGTAATSGTNYYYSKAPSLSQLSFVPKAGYQGTVLLPYTGYDTSGAAYSGTIEIAVSNDFCVNRFTDMQNYAWALPSVEFLFQNGITNGVTQTQFKPAQKIQRCDFLLMLCRAFQLRTNSTTSFPDVPADSYYAWAVATAKDLGITYGNGGLFLPHQNLTRQEAMVLIKRAMTAAGKSVPAGDPSILNAYTDGAQVSSYGKVAVASMVQMGVVQGNAAKQLKPMAPISRAEMAVILHRVLTF